MIRLIKAWRRRQQARRDSDDLLVLLVLDRGPATAMDISDATKMGSATVFPALWRLETRGLIDGYFVGSRYPRRRVYELRASRETVGRVDV